MAAMEETLRRHFGRLVEEKAALPDLVLVDGGKPQLNTAKLYEGNAALMEDLKAQIEKPDGKLHALH